MDRERKQLQHKFVNPQPNIEILTVESLGSGNLVSIRLFYEHINEVIDSLGAMNLRAEKVANNAITAMRKYQASKAPVGEHLADQLLLPMAIGSGGSFVTSTLSKHTLTNIEVIKALTTVKFTKEPLANHLWRITLKP